MKRTRILLAITALLILYGLANIGPPGSPAEAQTNPSSNKVLRSSALSAAGSPATSRGFRGNGTLGQPAPIGVGQQPGRILYAGFWYGRLRFLDPSGVSEVPGLINQLMQNHPNPFNPQTEIRFVAAERSRVTLEVFDLRGTRIRILVQGQMPAGNHRVQWDGTDDSGRRVSSGTYFYRLQVGDFEASNKMLLLK